MVFNWSLSDSNSSQVSRILLGILTDLHNAVVRMVFTPLISMSSRPFINLLVTVPKSPITTGIIEISCFTVSTILRLKYLSFF